MVALLAAAWGIGGPAQGDLAAYTAAPRVRVAPIAVFDSLLLLEPGAWSPLGTRLALVGAPGGKGPTRVFVIDPDRSGTLPRRVYDARQSVRSCGWSPDGTWLLILHGDPSPDSWRLLVAVPAEGGRPDTLLAGADLGPAVWGPEGRVYCRAGARWWEVAPPAAWKPRREVALGATQRAEIDTGLAVRILPFAPGDRGDPLFPGLFSTSGPRFKLWDALPDGSRYLVGISDGLRSARRLVDHAGATLLDLEEAGIEFLPGAVSADGRWIVGTAMEARSEAELPETWLEIADAGGLWTTRIEGGHEASEPQMSRRGSLIAFRSMRGTRIGRLIVEAR